MISSGSIDQADFTAKQEGSTSDNHNNDNISKQIHPSTSTSSWSRLKDPRIVRVSRAFGGKDRHSKVYTVRGLRDRRVRLSVPTAIQLYDLQERLGLNQPSKVVDWLLNAAKNEIDQLPPLQIPPGNFGQSLQPVILATNSHLVSPPDKLKGLKMSNWEEPLQLSRSIARETKRVDDEEGKNDDQERNFVSSNDFFLRNNHSSTLPSPVPNNVVPNDSFLRWDPSNLSLSSQFGSPHHQSEDVHGISVMPMPNQNLSSVPFGSHQLLVYPSQTQSYFPSHVTNASGEINFQMLSSSTSTSLTPPIYAISQGMRPNFLLSMNPNFFPSQNNTGTDPNKHS